MRPNKPYNSSTLIFPRREGKNDFLNESCARTINKLSQRGSYLDHHRISGLASVNVTPHFRITTSFVEMVFSLLQIIYSQIMRIFLDSLFMVSDGISTSIPYKETYLTGSFFPKLPDEIR